MRKRYQQETIDFRSNHDRWLISYADFITLMFAFFVVLYAMNTIKINKDTSAAASFKSQTIENVSIQSCPDNQSNVIHTEWLATNDNFLISLLPQPAKIQFNLLKQPEETVKQNTTDNKKIDLDKQNTQINAINNLLKQRLVAMINQGKVKIQQSSWGISIDINASILFGSADADLNQEAQLTLNTIASILKSESYPIRVEGYTDNKPIKNHNFPSNWELSSARASGVVRYFILQGIAAERLAAIGYAENNPIADNNTETGRARNRRVLLKILAENLDTGMDGVKTLKQPLN